METIRFGEGEILLENVTFGRLQESRMSTLPRNLVFPEDVAGPSLGSSVGW